MEKEYLGKAGWCGLTAYVLLPVPKYSFEPAILPLRYKPHTHTIHEKVIEKGSFLFFSRN